MDRRKVLSAALAVCLGLGIVGAPPAAMAQDQRHRQDDCRPGARNCQPQHERARPKNRIKKDHDNERIGPGGSDVRRGAQQDFDRKGNRYRQQEGKRYIARRPDVGDRLRSGRNLRNAEVRHLPRAGRGNAYRVSDGWLYLVDKDSGRVLRILGNADRWLR